MVGKAAAPLTSYADCFSLHASCASNSSKARSSHLVSDPINKLRGDNLDRGCSPTRSREQLVCSQICSYNNGEEYESRKSFAVLRARAHFIDSHHGRRRLACFCAEH